MIATRYIQRTVLMFVCLTILSKSIACAGDYASRDILGFSPDGRFFAFEQYGVQDGSGFPYAEIFIIDTESDRWVEGSPIRVLQKKESESPAAARKAARKSAASLLQKRKIGEAGEHLASNPRAELSANPHRVVVNAAHRFMPRAEHPLTFDLAEKELESAECAKYANQPLKGFTLTMTPVDETPIVLQDDKTLPESRGCALGYAIADILRHESGGKITYAVLLHVQTVGYEGPDGRFLAVTRRLPKGQ